MTDEKPERPVQVTIEDNRYYIEDFYKPENVQTNPLEGLKIVKNGIAGIVAEFRQAMQNDGQLIGMERIKIAEHIEETIENNIQFVLSLLAMHRKTTGGGSEAPAEPRVIDMSGELRGTELILTIMGRKYNLRGRFRLSDVGSEGDFFQSLALAVKPLERMAGLAPRFIEDGELTEEEFGNLNTEIFSTIYNLLLLKQKIRTLRINK